MVSLAGLEPSSKGSTPYADRAAASREQARYDAGLVDRFVTGDESALGEIMERHRARIFVIAYSLLKNRSDAEEIVQDTFIRAHRGLGSFRGECSLATWLHHIAVNLARNRYWYFFRRRRHATLSLDFAPTDNDTMTLTETMASGNAGPDRDAVTHEFSELVSACMERLNDRDRHILTLRNSQDRPYANIARELGIRIGTVKSRIARARGRLRILLAETDPEFATEGAPEPWFYPDRIAGGVPVIST